MAQPINKWTEFKQTLKQLANPEVQKRFETIVVDTADIAYDYCEKFICQRESVNTIGDVPYGGGYAMAKKEFDECLRSIVQMNYGLVLISHAVDKTFTDSNGVEFQKIVPTLGNSPRLICQRMCDIIGYSRAVEQDGALVTKLFMRGTSRFDAGSRFAYTPDSIVFNYQSLVTAISDAIDKQMAEDGDQFFTDTRVNINQEAVNTGVDFDDLMNMFTSNVNMLMEKDPAFYGPRITEIVSNRLGKGKKVSECSRDQYDIVSIIVDDVKDLLK